MSRFKHYPIISILLLGFLLRVVGIRFGLPLWVVGDEPSLIFGALKMIQLKTLLPVLHDAAFRGVFYYTPYISYLYILPFIIFMVLRFMVFPGSAVVFLAFLSKDPSSFFLIARVMSACAGTATIAIVHKAAKNLFEEECAALYSSLFMAFSELAVNFSHWARHWTFAALLFSAVFFILSQKNVPKEKKYVRASLIAGIGAGVSAQIALAAFFILLWFLLYDRLNFLAELKQKYAWKSVAVFCALAAFAYALWPRGFYVATGASSSILSGKNLAGLFGGYAFYAVDFFSREPIFCILSAFGFLALWQKKRNLFWPSFLFVAGYIAIFYLVFVNVGRFLLFLIPLFAIIAGYVLSLMTTWIWARNRLFAKALVFFVFAPMLFLDIRFDFLLVKNDTRVQALEWVYAHLPARTKIIAFSRLLRIPATQEAVRYQREAIDASSIRTIDAAEEQLPDSYFGHKRYDVINANAIVSSTFFAALPSYIRTNHVAYMVFSPKFAKEQGVPDDAGRFGSVQASFHGQTADGLGLSPVDGGSDGVFELWRIKNFGPDVVIVKL